MIMLPVYPLEVLVFVWKLQEGTGTKPYRNNLRLKRKVIVIVHKSNFTTVFVICLEYIKNTVHNLFQFSNDFS